MRKFSGRAAEIYAAGDSYRFETFLENCGDGWDWRMPDGLGWWEPHELLTFQDLDGAAIGAVETYHRSGRVSLDRCVDGPVKATGVCRPLTLLGVGETWELIVEAHVSQMETLQTSSAITKFGDTIAVIHRCPDVSIDSVIASLPHGAGSFIGFGSVSSRDPLVVKFDQEGVQYGRR